MLSFRRTWFPAIMGVVVSSAPALAQESVTPGLYYGPQMMGWYGTMWGATHMVFWLAVLVVIGVAIVWLVRSSAGTVRERAGSAIDLLDARYAKGEIEREDYLQRKQDLGR